MDRVQVLETKPEMVECASGKWLAVSRDTPRIGVVGTDADSAARAFQAELERWAELLEDIPGSHPS